jgi:transcriptional regulator GlxA family with amidase domain
MSRRLESATGRGPQAHLQHARIQHAKRLLETTTDLVDEIRRGAGYHDPAAFRRAFKRTTGLNPSEYRNAYGPRQLQQHPSDTNPGTGQLTEDR